MLVEKQLPNIEILSEQMKVLYGHFSFMSIANVLTVLVCAYLIYADVNALIIIVWVLALLSSIGFRIYLASQFKRHQPQGPAVSHWAKLAVISALLSGVLWALLVYLATYSSEQNFYIICFLMCTMLVVFLGPGSTYRPVFVAFAAPIMLSLIFCIVFYGNSEWYIGCVLICGMAILYNLNGHYAKSFLQSIYIRFENRALVEQLRFKNKRIESLLSEKNNLFVNVSHELRTPLTLILGPVKKLLNQPCDAVTKDSLQTIAHNGQRLSAMVEQLLTFSRMTYIEQQEQKSISLTHTLNVLTASLQSKLQEQGKALTVNTLPNIWMNLSPGDALETILLNLLTNAIKYTPQGSQISIDVSQVKKNRVEISVTDNGGGIPEEQHSRVFERFARLEQHQRSDIEGAGLGLALVKELIELNKGRIMLETNQQGGATFTLRLPCFIQADNAVEESSGSELSGKTLLEQNKHLGLEYDDNEESYNADRGSILIIDDTADIGRYLKSELKFDYRVLLAEDGFKGLEMAKKHAPSLVICDVMMPGIDGFEVLKRLRNDIEISHTPIILLTARGDKESRIKGYQYQADDYITKPFDMDELKARVGNLIKLRSSLQKFAAAILAADGDNITEPLAIYQSSEDDFLTKFQAMIANNYQDSRFQVDDMSRIMGLSPSPLGKKIKALLGCSPYQYLRIYRLERASKILKSNFNGSLGKLSDTLGFASQQHFATSFREYFGQTPKDFRKQVPVD